MGRTAKDNTSLATCITARARAKLPVSEASMPSPLHTNPKLTSSQLRAGQLEFPFPMGQINPLRLR